uniref:Signal recognition particle subunit SRP68 n=1 Tax=Lynceus sp. MCZ IZ 141354 TaxID=1930659 RepID=A0A9N6WR28_9CRUS|nr:EOG090X04NF [Lynceus sp. MCZ IZ 141354]
MPENIDKENIVPEIESENSGKPTSDGLIPQDVHTLKILKLIRDTQQQHGLRHGDYQRYRGYCTRRLQRLRKALRLPQGDKKHFKKRDVTLENIIKDARYLYIPLVQSERAWGYAMQLKQEFNTEPRKRFHMVNKLRKAVKYASHLEYLCTSSAVCDARAKVEAQAYSSFIKGTLFFESRKWRQAMEEYQKCKNTYEALLTTLGDEAEKAVYRQKCDELIPSLRFCAYNLSDDQSIDLQKIQSQISMPDADLEKLIAQAKEKQTQSLLEVNFANTSVPVRLEKVRAFLLSVGEKPQKDSVDAQLEHYESLLMDCKDCIQLVKEQENNGLLISYLTFLRFALSVERNMLLIEQMKSNENSKKVKPQDYVRLYEAILQFLNEIQSVFTGHDRGLKDVDILNTYFRAQRCLAIANTLQHNKQYLESVILYDKCMSYVNQLKNAKLGSVEMSRFSRLLDGVAAIEDSLQSGMAHAKAQNILEQSAPSQSTPNQTVYDNPDEFIEFSDKGGLELIKLPPAMRAVPCKPLFFDLALNHVQFPDLSDKVESRKAVTAGAGLSGFVKGLWGWKK